MIGFLLLTESVEAFTRPREIICHGSSGLVSIRHAGAYDKS